MLNTLKNSRPWSKPYRKLCCLGLVLTQSLTAADGVIPNQSYPVGEQWTIISPQLGTRHQNQPSVFNGYAILAGNAEHEIWDISNPYSPVKKAEMISNHAAGEAESHQVTYGKKGNTYYMATISGKGIDIWDVTNTTNPTAVGEIVLPGINYGDVAGAVWGVSWQGNYIYCGATTNGLYVVDVSNPSSPSHVATLSRSALGGVSAGPVFAMGDVLVVTTPKTTAGVATVDISDPLNPRLMDSVSPSSSSYIGGFYGGNAYLITPFRPYDVLSDPYHIEALASTSVPASEYQSYANDKLYLGGLRGGTQGIYRYDISDPESPVLEGIVVGRDSRWDDQFSCSVGNLIVIADDQLVDNQYVGAVIAVQDTAPDNTPITVKKVMPANGSVGQSLSGQIGISLSEWPEFASVNASSVILRRAGGAPVAGSWGCTYTTLTFAPDEPLDPFTQYEVVLAAGGVTDLVGNAIAETYLSSFWTGSGSTGFAGNEEINPVPAALSNTSTNFSVKTPDASRIYSWEFGDGESAQGTSVSHTYTDPGRYIITFQTSNVDEVVYEAEAATLEGGVVTATNHSGYTGTGFADYPGTEGAAVKISWEVDRSEAGVADITIRYGLGATTARPLNLYVNGAQQTTLNLVSTVEWTSWTDYTVSGLALEEGTNVIELRADAGSVGPNVDHMRLSHENPGGDLSSFSFTHVVYNQPTALPPASSQALLRSNGLIWAVNADIDTVSAVDAETLVKTHEIAVGDEPKAIAEAPDGKLWVVCRKSWEIKVIDPSLGTVVDTVGLPYASQPVGLAFAPDGSACYVTLQAVGRLLKLDPAVGSELASLNFGPDSQGIVPKVRGLAITADSTRVLVSRFVSPDTAGEVYEVDAASMTLTATIPLAKSTGTDSPQFSRGIPNYLTSVTISPDGTRAWLPSKKDNIDRGGIRDGQELDHDVTVRAITSVLDLEQEPGAELSSERIDYDDSDRCHACSFSPLGDLVFVAMAGNKKVKVMDAWSGAEVAALDTAEVPEGSVIDPATGRLFVLNFLGRSLSVFDVSEMLNGGSTASSVGEVSLVETEVLTAEVLHGKKLFYDASSTQLNLAGYMSCASCHLDGEQDGRTYDFSAPMGEGFRNTIDLTGRSGVGHGRVHWTGNFDEIHDFEGQIRLLGKGTGLMSDASFNSGTRSEALGDPKGGVSADLDALAAYLKSLDSFPPSPHRSSTGQLTTEAVAGKAHFQSLNCASCHGGSSFTDSSLGSLHDVGTLTANSGQRMGETLTGLDTPTLRGVWSTAPYLHDGSASTLRDVLTTKNITDAHGAVSTLSESEIDELVAYLKQIDGLEGAADPVEGVGVISFTDYMEEHGLTGNVLTGLDDDADGDGFSNRMEFLLGGSDPGDRQSQPSVAYRKESVLEDDFYQMSWLKRSGGVWKSGAYVWGAHQYTPQGSIDLSGWSTGLTVVPNPAGLPAAPTGYEWTTSRFYSPMSVQPQGFLRLQTEEPAE